MNNETSEFCNQESHSSSENFDDLYETADLWWLLNDFPDSEWTIRAHLNGNPHSTWRVSWEPVCSRGKMRVHWRQWQRFGQRIAFLLMEHPENAPVKPSTLVVYCREIRAICEWFCFERRVSEASALRREDIEAFFTYIESLSLSRNHVLTKFVLLRRFNEYKGLLGEGIAFDPFRAYGSLTRYAKKVGEPARHTATIYPQKFFHVLDSALKTLSGSEELLKRLDEYMQIRRLATSRRNISRLYKKRYGESSSKLQKGVTVLYGACVTILLSLWGERKHELLNITYEGVKAFLDEGGDEISGIEHKTSGTFTGKRTQRAAISEVCDALAVISQMTRWTRDVSDSKWFFVRMPFGHSANQNPQTEITTASLYTLLDTFSEHSGVGLKLRPHMFRRSFSLLWAWRFEVGDLEMLSKLLYHNNDVFTRFYTEDEDVWEFLPEAEGTLAFNIIRDSLLGSRKMAGALGATLERYRRRITAKFGVLSVDEADRFGRRLLAEGGYRVIANADGFCFINEARGHRAKCSTDGCTPNYANRSEKVCPDCPNFGVDESRTEYWQNRKQSHEDVLKSTSVEMLAMASRKSIAKAEKILARIPVKQLE